MDFKLEKQSLKKGDVIEWTPQKGHLCGITLICTVVEVLRVVDATTFEPIDRVCIEFEYNGHKEQLMLAADADYKIISCS